MEVISHQAERIRVCNWIDVSPPQFHEVGVIPLLEKDVLVVIPAIEDVIGLSEFQWNGIGGHVGILLLLREET